MSVPLLAAAGGMATTLFLYALLVAGRSSTAPALPSSEGEATALVPNPRLNRWIEVRKVIHTRIDRPIERSTTGRTLRQRLSRAGIALWPAEWLALSALVAAALGVLLAWRFQWLPAAAIGVAIGIAGSHLLLNWLVARRDRAFRKQLGPAILAIANAVRAGHTFNEAMRITGEAGQPPISLELLRTTREMQLGVPLTEALQRLVERNQSDDLRLVALAVQIQQQVGGNLAEILANIEETIRERVRIKGEIATLTAQAKVSGWILIALPFALGGILTVIAPSYFGPMLHKPLGMVMLGFAGFAMACGWGLIRKIVNVKV